MLQSNHCLIIAQSARALAASANMGGLTPHVLDRFADQDTIAAAASCQLIPVNDGSWDVGKLLEILEPYRTMPLCGVIYGSDLEAHYDVLESLSRHWLLFGNTAAVVKTCKEPSLFFPMLSRLGIAYPETNLEPPPEPAGDDNWIVKQTGASGGGHIHGLTKHFRSGSQRYYFQRKLSGRTLSAVFLANGMDAYVVGLNEIWTVAPEKNDFRYRGAVTLYNLPCTVVQTIEKMLRLLVRETGLRGLCGIDVIVTDDGRCQVLEINPRPTATFELHQTNQSLYVAHILACKGALPSLPPKPQGILRAHQVLYANRDFDMPRIDWPDWASDRSCPGRHIKSNDPVCMVHAQATNMNDLKALLQQRTAALEFNIGLQKAAA